MKLPPGVAVFGAGDRPLQGSHPVGGATRIDRPEAEAQDTHFPFGGGVR
jgi:hypothetical protein